MRSDRVSIEQAHQMMLKFFASGYNLEQVVKGFKQSRTRSAILQSLQQSLKDILIELEGQVYAAKYIKTLRIYDNFNITRIRDQIINLKDILNAQTGSDLLVYYKYKHQFVILTRFQVIEVPVQPVTSKKKYSIYQAFIDYLQIKGVFDQKIYYKIPEKYRQKTPIQISQSSIYTPQQMTQILKLYEAYEGRVSEICGKMKLRGYSMQKYKKQRVRQLLIQNISIGIGRVYKLSNNLDRFSGCAWDKFQSIHMTMIKNFSFEEKLKMLKAGMHNTIEDIDVYEICQKIGIRYRPVGYPKWVKDNSHHNLYRRQKMSVLDKIRDQMRGIIKNQMKKPKRLFQQQA